MQPLSIKNILEYIDLCLRSAAVTVLNHTDASALVVCQHCAALALVWFLNTVNSFRSFLY